MFKIFLLLFLSLSCLSVFAANGPLYDKMNKRDPFVPFVTNDGQLTNIKDQEESSAIILGGIFFDEQGKSMAIINGEIVKKDDMISGVKIVEIRKDSVVYAKDSELFIVNLKVDEEGAK